MPNDLPTDRLPTMAETRAMHEQAVRARKKQRLQKTLVTIAVTLLAIMLLAALALFVRAKLQTLDKPLDAKTNQTAQTQPQEPSIEPDSQASEQPEPETPEADPDAEYEKTIEIDLDKLEPTVSYPHLPENTHLASEGKDIKIDQVVIGSCTIGLNSSMTFYDAMLPDITTDERMDAVSSSGYAWGYIGSTVPFIICLALIMGGPALGVPTMLATRLSFIITGAWWLIFTLPLIRTYKQKYGRERGPEDTIGHIVGGVFSEVGHTMREIAHNKTVLVYMIAFFFYIDGVHTVISMATSYGSALGIDSTQLVLALLVTQFVAFPSAIIYGKLAGRVGTLNMILVAVAAYMGIVLFAAFFLKTAFEFWVLAIMVGLFQGGVQALSRSYFGRIIPKEKSNEYYGFFDIFGRYASVMGTFLVSVVTSLTGNPSLGVLSIGVLLVVGFVLLVRLSRMSQTAEQAA